MQIIIIVQVKISCFKFSLTKSIQLDINECITDNGGCEQSCHNTIGSYYCSCNNNYTLNTDHHHCDGKFDY